MSARPHSPPPATVAGDPVLPGVVTARKPGPRPSGGARSLLLAGTLLLTVSATPATAAGARQQEQAPQEPQETKSPVEEQQPTRDEATVASAGSDDAHGVPPAPPAPPAPPVPHAPPAAGVRVYVDPQTGELTGEPAPGQVERLLELGRRLAAARAGVSAGDERRPRTAPTFVTPVGLGSRLDDRFLHALRLRRGPDGEWRTVCEQHDAGGPHGHDHPADGGATATPDATAGVSGAAAPPQERDL